VHVGSPVPEWLRGAMTEGPSIPPAQLLFRLAAALVLGGLVAIIYGRTRPGQPAAPSFTTTLVLLAILIAMVTQVIGDNVARAFSLVGALSIVRFRTVVRDTQDTAYVICSVAVGMAVGAGNLGVAVAGLAVVGLAAVIMMRAGPPDVEVVSPPFVIRIRVGLGTDLEAVVGAVLEAHTVGRRMTSLTTARQGMALDVSYRADLRNPAGADAVVKALNRLEGVQAVSLERVDPGADVT